VPGSSRFFPHRRYGSSWPGSRSLPMGPSAISSKARGICAVTVLWIAAIAAAVLRLRPRDMPVDDMDFAIDVAAWSNWISLGLIVATIPLD